MASSMLWSCSCRRTPSRVFAALPRTTMAFCRALASLIFCCKAWMSSPSLARVPSKAASSSLIAAAISSALAFSTRAARARSSRCLATASSALRCQSSASSCRRWRRRSNSFLSAMARAEVVRTSTSVPSISWRIMRTIFSGSSALSSKALMLELTMSVMREKTLIGCASSKVLSIAVRCRCCVAFRNRASLARYVSNHRKISALW